MIAPPVAVITRFIVSTINAVSVLAVEWSTLTVCPWPHANACASSAAACKTVVHGAVAVVVLLVADLCAGGADSAPCTVFPAGSDSG